jgi:hypothetical protein
MKLCRCYYRLLDRTEYYMVEHSACDDDKEYVENVIDCKTVEVKLTFFGWIRYQMFGFVLPDMIKSERVL